MRVGLMEAAEYLGRPPVPPEVREAIRGIGRRPVGKPLELQPGQEQRSEEDTLPPPVALQKVT